MIGWIQLREDDVLREGPFTIGGIFFARQHPALTPLRAVLHPPGGAGEHPQHAESQTARTRMCSDEQKVVLESNGVRRPWESLECANASGDWVGPLEIEPAKPGTLVRAIFPLGG